MRGEEEEVELGGFLRHRVRVHYDSRFIGLNPKQQKGENE